MKAKGTLALEFKGNRLHPTSGLCCGLSTSWLCYNFHFMSRFWYLFSVKRQKIQVNKSSNWTTYQYYTTTARIKQAKNKTMMKDEEKWRQRKKKGQIGRFCLWPSVCLFHSLQGVLWGTRIGSRFQRCWQGWQSSHFNLSLSNNARQL